MIKFDPDTTWFSADFHLGHINFTRGVSKWDDKRKCRDFDTVEEMTETVIKSVNDTVPYDHRIINVGDILFGPKNKFHEFFDRINCKNHIFLKGNHDDWFDKPEYAGYSDRFEWYDNYLECSFGKKLVCIFHYAARVWRDSHKGSYFLFGHSHNTLPPVGRQLDVGWDVWKRPISFREVDRILSKVPVNFVDHHNPSTT